MTFKKRQSKKANKEKPKKEKATKEKPAKKAKKTVEAKEASSKPRGGVGMEYPVDQALSEFVGSSVCSRGTVMISMFPLTHSIRRKSGSTSRNT